MNPIEPLYLDSVRVYRIGDALQLAGISRATYFRWVKSRRIRDTRFKDRNGRRVFTGEEVQELKAYADRLVEVPQIELPLKA